MDECSAGAQSCGLNELCPHGLLKQLTACSLCRFLSQRLSALDFSFKQTSNETLSLSLVSPPPLLWLHYFVTYLSEFVRQGSSKKTVRELHFCEHDNGPTRGPDPLQVC